MSQVPETIGNSISHETIVDDMRADGMLPPKMPEWEAIDGAKIWTDNDIDRLVLSDTAFAQINHGAKVGSVVMFIHASSSNLTLPSSPSARRLAALQFFAAEMERALPIVRAMIERDKWLSRDINVLQH